MVCAAITTNQTQLKNAMNKERKNDDDDDSQTDAVQDFLCDLDCTNKCVFIKNKSLKYNDDSAVSAAVNLLCFCFDTWRMTQQKTPRIFHYTPKNGYSFLKN